MILHMSRGFVLGVLSTVFVVGGTAGYLVRGSSGAKLADRPPLALARDVIDEPSLSPAPSLPKPVPPHATAAVKSVPTPGNFYRLADKETLSDVAKRAYGSTKRTPDIVTANPTLDPKRLQPGTLIYVPAGIEPIPTPVELAKTTESAMSAAKPAASPTPPVFAKPK